MRADLSLRPVVAGVVINQAGKYLLVQEKKQRAYGLWNWPAGHLESGETVEQTARREAKEETGYDVRLLEKINIDNKPEASLIKHLFVAEIVGGELVFPDDEILDVQWFSKEDLKKISDRLRNPWIWKAINILESKS